MTKTPRPRPTTGHKLLKVEFDGGIELYFEVPDAGEGAMGAKLVGPGRGRRGWVPGVRIHGQIKMIVFRDTPPPYIQMAMQIAHSLDGAHMILVNPEWEDDE